MESKEYINQMHNELDRIDRTRKRDKAEIVAQCLNQVRGMKAGGIDDNQIDIVAKLVKYCILMKTLDFMHCRILVIELSDRSKLRETSFRTRKNP